MSSPRKTDGLTPALAWLITLTSAFLILPVRDASGADIHQTEERFRSISGSAYDIIYQESIETPSPAKGLHAVNPANGLRLHFLGSGPRITPWNETAPEWMVGLQLAGTAPQGTLRAVFQTEPTAHRHTVSYDRAPTFERYDNNKTGLRISVESLDLSAGEAGEIVYHINTNLTMGHAATRDEIAFLQAGLRVMRLRLVEVVDGAGAPVPAHLSVDEEALTIGWSPSIHQPPSGVRAELLLTGTTSSLAGPPLSQTPDWMAESNQAGANLGWSVASAGDVNGDGYDDIIAGAWRFENGQAREGAAFLYFGSATGPGTSADWMAEGDQVAAQFGWSVAGIGDINGDGFDDIAVGADLYDAAEVDAGGAWVYLGSSTGPSSSPDWFADGVQEGTRYGHSVAAAGDVNGDGYDDFIVTAPNFDSPELDEGVAYVYAGSPSGLPSAPTWTIETNQPGAFLNIARSAGDINGDGYDDIIAAAFLYDNGQIDEGRVFVHLGSASGLSTTAVWTAEGNSAGLHFGFFSGSAGDVNADGYDDVLVIADRYSNPQTSEGAAFLWYGGPAGLILNGVPGTPQNAEWRTEGDQTNGFLRWGGSAQDVNSDGYEDVIVGTALYSNGQAQEGRASLFLGSSTGLETTPAWTAEGEQTGARFGWSLSSAGDTNGDGASDVVVGAYLYDNGQGDEGSLFLFNGTAPVTCLDSDGDGFGSPGSPACPGGATPDCDDSDATAYPGAPEICDGVDNNCDGAVDENGLVIQADSSIQPTTLNVNSHGTALAMTVSLTNVCDPSNPIPIDGRRLEQTHVSRAGNVTLPDPEAISCPALGGDYLFERGIFDNILARVVNNNAVTLKFNLASDGDCLTRDGDRQDVIALLTDVLDGSEKLVCIASKVNEVALEACAPVVIKNHGNR